MKRHYYKIFRGNDTDFPKLEFMGTFDVKANIPSDYYVGKEAFRILGELQRNYIEKKKDKIFFISPNGEIVQGKNLYGKESRICRNNLMLGNELVSSCGDETCWMYVEDEADLPLMFGEDYSYKKGGLFRYEWNEETQRRKWVNLEEDIAFFEEKWLPKKVPFLADYVCERLEEIN